jgi:acyl carrier protein
MESTADQNSITSQLKKLIAEELDVNLTEENISESAPLFEGGFGIDSIAIVELISLIEDKFGVQFNDDDLVPESFQNLEVLSKLVSGKLETLNP